MAEQILGAADNGREISASAGDELVVELRENATTGYRWALDGDLPGGLKLLGDDYAPGGAAPGAAGTRRFHLRATAAGAGALSFKLWREWQGDASITQRFGVTVSVSA